MIKRHFWKQVKIYLLITKILKTHTNIREDKNKSKETKTFRESNKICETKKKKQQKSNDLMNDIRMIHTIDDKREQEKQKFKIKRETQQ